MHKIFGGNDSKYQQIKQTLGKRTQSDSMFQQLGVATGIGQGVVARKEKGVRPR